MPSLIIDQDQTTVLLHHFENSAASNGLVQNSLVSSGTFATAYTSIFKKFGSYSLLINPGAGQTCCLGDYPATTTFEVNKRFTIDAWVYMFSVGISTSIVELGSSGVNTGIWVAPNGITPNLKYLYNGTTYGSSATSLNTWHHVALVRDSDTNLTFYVDGISVSTQTIANGTTGGQSTIIGSGNPGIASYAVDEVRVSNVAKWTANFTPPTAAWDNVR